MMLETAGVWLPMWVESGAGGPGLARRDEQSVPFAHGESQPDAEAFKKD